MIAIFDASPEDVPDHSTGDRVQGGADPTSAPVTLIYAVGVAPAELVVPRPTGLHKVFPVCAPLDVSIASDGPEHAALAGCFAEAEAGAVSVLVTQAAAGAGFSVPREGKGCQSLRVRQEASCPGCETARLRSLQQAHNGQKKKRPPQSCKQKHFVIFLAAL